jgi:hypothetical protein
LTEKLKFFDALAEIVAEVAKPVPPHPAEELVGFPVKPSTPISVFGELKLLLTDAVVLDAGMSQDPKVSAKVEEEMANPNAQNADTNLTKPLPFILFIDPSILPIHYNH